MKSSSMVNVILPTYNRAGSLERSVQSVLNQTYTNFVLIIVDDGSKDNTEQIVNNLMAKDNRVVFIKHTVNMGCAAARNTGIKVAKSGYLAFQDSDDEWMPDKLEKQMKVLTATVDRVDIVYTDMWKITANAEYYFPSPHLTLGDKDLYRRALDFGVANIGIGTVLMKKECFTRTGPFDEKLPRLIDYEYFIRAARDCKFYHIAEPLVKYITADAGVTSNPQNLVLARKMILEKYYEDIKNDKNIFARHYLEIGISLCRSGDIKEEESYSGPAFQQHLNGKKDKRLISNHYFRIGTCLGENGDLRMGRQYIRKAIKTEPLNLKYLFGYIMLSAGRNMFAQVSTIYRKINYHILQGK